MLWSREKRFAIVTPAARKAATGNVATGYVATTTTKNSTNVRLEGRRGVRHISNCGNAITNGKRPAKNFYWPANTNFFTARGCSSIFSVKIKSRNLKANRRVGTNTTGSAFATEKMATKNFAKGGNDASPKDGRIGESSRNGHLTRTRKITNSRPNRANGRSDDGLFSLCRYAN